MNCSRLSWCGALAAPSSVWHQAAGGACLDFVDWFDPAIGVSIIRVEVQFPAMRARLAHSRAAMILVVRVMHRVLVVTVACRQCDWFVVQMCHGFQNVIARCSIGDSTAKCANRARLRKACDLLGNCKEWTRRVRSAPAGFDRACCVRIARARSGCEFNFQPAVLKFVDDCIASGIDFASTRSRARGRRERATSSGASAHGRAHHGSPPGR